MRVGIIGGGICGLTLALALERRSIRATVYEAVPEVKPLGVGISLLPHGTGALARLGLLKAIERVAVRFRDSRFFTRHGQLVFVDPAPVGSPQFLIHRAALHQLLLDAVYARLGPEHVRFGRACVGFAQDEQQAIAHFADGEVAEADVLIGCDGIHSALRRQLYPHEGGPVFSGINLWRGAAWHEPILSGGSHARIGTLDVGKLVVYPIRDAVESGGPQLLNWVAELRQPDAAPAEWNGPGRLEDFAHVYRHWQFDWLDVPQLLKDSHVILQYPMSDRDPLSRWSFERVTLAGDAAHAMVPRGSNGATQSILDGIALADALAAEGEPRAALRRYEAERLPAANRVLTVNRATPPDTLIQMVEDRSGGRPFARLEDLISVSELRTRLENYKQITGYDDAKLAASIGTQEETRT